ncbi:hypothetical protein DMENIID0001_035340 [Sergentomyia squamirostris]
MVERATLNVYDKRTNADDAIFVGVVYGGVVLILRQRRSKSGAKRWRRKKSREECEVAVSQAIAHQKKK